MRFIENRQKIFPAYYTEAQRQTQAAHWASWREQAMQIADEDFEHFCNAIICGLF
jgi:hypothetical protein